MEEDYYEPDLSLEGNGLPAFGGPLPPPYDDGSIEEKRYTITLADGRELTNLRLSGNNFVSELPVFEEQFDYNLSPVIISDGTVSETHENMELNHLQVIDGKWYFVLLDVPPEEMWKRKVTADMQYMSMMTEVELD